MNFDKKPEDSKTQAENFDPNDSKYNDPRNESQVFSYSAPWLIYSLGFSCKPNQLYKIAVGSFLEEKENQVCFLIKIQFIFFNFRLKLYN